MVVGDDRVHAAFSGVSDLRMRGNTVVDGDDQPDAVPLHRIDGVDVQTVPFSESARQEIRHVRMQTRQRVRQNRRCADAVRIIVPVHADPFSRVDRKADPGNCTIHVRERKRIRQRLHFRVQKRRDRSVVRKPASYQHRGESARKSEPRLHIADRSVGNGFDFVRTVTHRA